jgi:putative Holliday junction resolvase
MKPTPMRTLAIDPGKVRVGLAISDSAGKFATPHAVIPAANAVETILKLIDSESVEQIVIGLPLNMDGTIGPSAKESIAFSKKISSKCAKPIVFVDERLSSFQAESDMTSRKRRGEKITRKQKKSRLDALAAAVFLQDFLDGKLDAIDIKFRYHSPNACSNPCSSNRTR